MSSNLTLVVRRLGGVDLRATVELLQHHRQAYGKVRPVEELRPAVQAALEDSDRTLLIGAFQEGLPGFAHGKLVGLLIMNVLVSLEHVGEVGWIEDLYVREDYRRQGLGERLLGQALDWATARGLRAIDLEMGEAHELGAAARLYEKHGFAKIQRARLTRVAHP
jgi:GNAT superfamily N-acetyltransferase